MSTIFVRQSIFDENDVKMNVNGVIVYFLWTRYIKSVMGNLFARLFMLKITQYKCIIINDE